MSITSWHGVSPMTLLVQSVGPIGDYDLIPMSSKRTISPCKSVAPLVCLCQGWLFAVVISVLLVSRVWFNLNLLIWFPLPCCRPALLLLSFAPGTPSGLLSNPTFRLSFVTRLLFLTGSCFVRKQVLFMVSQCVWANFHVLWNHGRLFHLDQWFCGSCASVVSYPATPVRYTLSFVISGLVMFLFLSPKVKVLGWCSATEILTTC